MLLLSCTNLSRGYDATPLFEGVAFELHAGDRVGLVGPNGAGKTTLLKVLAGLDEPDTGKVLSGLGFAEADYHREIVTFSGGQQRRLLLAKLLLSAPDVMLLDEPSNHLDIDTTRWLEGYLARQPQGMILVSHDRYFLDKV